MLKASFESIYRHRLLALRGAFCAAIIIGGSANVASADGTPARVNFPAAGPEYSNAFVPRGPAPEVLEASLLCQRFARNPMCHPLPLQKSIAPASQTWAKSEFGGTYAMQYITISTVAHPFSDPQDSSEPLAAFPVGAKYIDQKIICDLQPIGQQICALSHENYKVIKVPAGMEPEGSSDHHYSFDDYARGGEQDFYLAPLPDAKTGVMHVAGAGFCTWGTDGTGCSGSTATLIDTALGGLNPGLIKAAESDPVHGHLPYAIAFGALCAAESSNFVYPAKYSDGDNTNTTPLCKNFLKTGMRPPEGTRWFLALHDADINSKKFVPWIKVVLRTLDEDHMGGSVVDSAWAFGGGMAPDYQRGDWSFAAYEMGIDPKLADYQLPFNVDGLNFAKNARFCTNGFC